MSSLAVAMSDDTRPAIRARNIVKTFHTVRRESGFLGTARSLVAPRRVARTVVNDISFEVGRGELVAMLGPNGAGKSTTIKMLTGILVPTSGEIEVAGAVPHRDRIRNARAIGAVFGQRTQLWWDLPVRDSLAILRDIYEVDPGDYRKRLHAFDTMLELSAYWDSPVRQLSLGQRVRADLAAALLHDPMVVFLDEPTIGMDVVVKAQVREFLADQVNRRGRTVLLTTHDMTEVSRLAERILLIIEGQLVFEGSVDGLRRGFGGTWRIRVTFEHPIDEPIVPGIRLIEHDGIRARYGPQDTAAPAAANGRPVTAQNEALKRIIETYPIRDVALEDEDLEGVMRAAFAATDGPEPSTCV